MSWAPIDLKAEARRASRIAEKTGWQRPNWDTNFIAKLGFIRGELDEAVLAALVVADRGRPARDDSEKLHHDYAAELADVAIRLFAVLHDIWGDDWLYEVEQRPPMTVGPFCEPDVLLRPVRNSLRYAEEQWRKGRDDARDGALSGLTGALDALFDAASASCVDLGAAIVAKQTMNEMRPRLHGKKNDLG